MSDLFFNLGRKLGRVAVPALRKSKWLWQSVAGSERESIRAETLMGRALAREVASRMGEPEEAPDHRLVAGIGAQLAAALNHEFRTFEVATIRSGEPNAMALPGGHVFLDVTLLDLCERNADELAFIIGHDMAHVVRRHTFDRILRRVGTEMVSTILGRGAIGHWLTRSGMDMLRSAHSQDTELEADEMGSDLAALAGFDRTAALRLLKRLHPLREQPEGLPEYFQTHPTERVRAAHLKAHWEENDPQT